MREFRIKNRADRDWKKDPGVIYYDRYEIVGKQIYICGDEEGVSFIGSPDEKLEEIYKFQFLIELVQGTGRFNRVAEYIDNIFSGMMDEIDFTISLYSGNVISQRVWQAIMKVPHGETVTYSQFQKEYCTDLPEMDLNLCQWCIRTNPLLFVVPSHRFIRQDGRGVTLRGNKTLANELTLRERWGWHWY